MMLRTVSRKNRLVSVSVSITWYPRRHRIRSLEIADPKDRSERPEERMDVRFETLARLAIAMLVVITVTAGGPASIAGVDDDLAAAKKLFERNLDAIKKQDREAYLACYLQNDALVRTGPTGYQLGRIAKRISLATYRTTRSFAPDRPAISWVLPTTPPSRPRAPGRTSSRAGI
jgi:hypothetical protein